MEKKLSLFVQAYYKKKFPKNKFLSGVSLIPVSGKVFNEEELKNGIESVLDGWWTEGKFAEQFEKSFASLLGVRYVSLVNSGSSANLVAFSALTSRALNEKALRPGDEVITIAAGFPATVNPVIQNKCIPVFLYYLINCCRKTSNYSNNLITRS